MEKGKKFVRKHYDVPEKISKKIVKAFEKYDYSKKDISDYIMNLSKHNLEQLNKTISEIHKIKYRNRKRIRLLGNQSKAIPWDFFLELVHYFKFEKRLQLCVLIQGICGLAESDVVRLKFKDFDFDEHYLRYNRIKTHKDVDPPLHPLIESEIKKWYQENKEEIEKHDNYLFFSNAVVRSEEHITEGWLRNNVADALKKLGYWKKYADSIDNRELHKYTDHSLRGCAATKVFKQHHNIREVQQLLGHSPNSIEHTMVYIQDEDSLLFKDVREEEIKL